MESPIRFEVEGQKFDVVFLVERIKYCAEQHGQTVITCVIRDSPHESYCGVAVQSPEDKRDDARGRRIAFKRAIEGYGMAMGLFTNSQFKRLDHDFRVAYGKALGIVPQIL